MSTTPTTPDNPHSTSPNGTKRTHTTSTVAVAAASTALIAFLGTTLVTAGNDSDVPDAASPAATATPDATVPDTPTPGSAASDSAAPSTSNASDQTGPDEGREPVEPTASERTASEPTGSAVVPEQNAAPSPQRAASAGTAGALSTNGADIVDADGTTVTLRGVNWFGFETQVGAPHGLWSRNLDDMIGQIDELGFNSIRLPFSAAMLEPTYVPNGIDYGQNPDLEGLTSLEVMDRVIDAAGAADLDVILDRHALAPDDRHHLWYDDQFPQERLVSDWQLLAERYGDRENVIGADLYNEPHDEACWGCGDIAVDWKLAAEAAGDAIHEIDPDWLIIVEGVEQPDGASCDGPDATGCTWWGGALADAGAEPIELAVPNKVVYSPHEYATSVYRQPWFDDPEFPANMPAIWDANWGYLETGDIAPVLVGEFGTTLASSTDAIWLETLLVYLDEIGADFTFWSFNPNSGDTGGVLLDDWTTVDENKMAYLEP